MRLSLIHIFNAAAVNKMKLFAGGEAAVAVVTQELLTFCDAEMSEADGICLLYTSLDEAREIDPRYEIGDAVEYQVTPRDFGRIAAQTAKQVVVQRIREAERGMVYDDYIQKQGEIITGTVERISNERCIRDRKRAARKSNGRAGAQTSKVEYGGEDQHRFGDDDE